MDTDKVIRKCGAECQKFLTRCDLASLSARRQPQRGRAFGRKRAYENGEFPTCGACAKGRPDDERNGAPDDSSRDSARPVTALPRVIDPGRRRRLSANGDPHPSIAAAC